MQRLFLGVVTMCLSSGAAAYAANVVVNIPRFVYVPSAITINVGDTVTWTNNDGTLHTSTSGPVMGPGAFTPDGVFETGILVPGQASAAIPFNTAGVFTYYCAVHFNFMGTGAITVLAPAAVDIASANPPAVNPFTGSGPFRDVLQTGTTASLTQGVGGATTPAEDSITYDTVSVTFSGTPSPLPTTRNIGVACAGGATPCPTVIGVTGSGPGPYALTLSDVIPPGACTTFTFAGTNAGQKLQYQSLPGDVSLSGSVATGDALVLVNAINSLAAADPANLARYDINRTGSVSATDVARLVGLLNGVNTTQSWLTAVVAACP